MTRGDNSRYHHGVETEPADLTERLLDAAASVFAERGYDRAGVAEIARRAGVTTGAIYSRYSGKAELMIAAADRCLPPAFRRLLSGQRDDRPATDILAALGAHLVREANPDTPMVMEAVVAARRDPELGERLRSRLEAEELHLAKLVDEAKADGRFDPALSTDALVRLSHAIGIGMNALTGLGLPVPDQHEWSEVIDRLLVAASVPPDFGGNP